jgi:hypothetical protein
MRKQRVHKAKARDNNDIHLWVPKKSKEVLK